MAGEQVSGHDSGEGHGEGTFPRGLGALLVGWEAWGLVGKSSSLRSGDLGDLIHSHCQDQGLCTG